MKITTLKVFFFFENSSGIGSFMNLVVGLFLSISLRFVLHHLHGADSF